jgi:lipoprotein-anchoring transpeptidase ErfK/SrfK
MSNSSVLADYSTTLNDTITISNGTGSSYYYTGGGSGNTITINNSSAMSGTISVGTISTGTFTIGTGDSAYTWKTPEEFIDTFPNFDRIQKMCEQYPGFKIAFEKFKTTYYLIKDDYDTPEDKRPKP